MINDITQFKLDSPSNQMGGNNALIEILNLKKSFGAQEVLKNVSFDLFPGENLVMLGKSGTGKSVIIKCIVRLIQADSGLIKIFGKDVNTLNRVELIYMREKIGFLFQSGALYDSMTVKQNLEFPLRRLTQRLTEKEIEDKVYDVLDHLGLSNTLHKMPSQLSGGMRKRISLARTIIVNPLIMLYDEPTTGLDPVTSSEISNLINEVKLKYKTSSIIITHDIKCASITADRILMLQDGAVYKEGTKTQMEAEEDPLVRSFYE